MQQTKYKYLVYAVNVFVLSFSLVNNTYGGIKTATLYVTATVIANCEVGVGKNMDFDDFTNLDSTNKKSSKYSDVSIRCPRNTQYDIELDAGDNMTNNERMISDGSSKAFYEIFNDRTNEEWGPDYIGGEQLEDQLSTGKLESYKLRADLYHFDSVEYKKNLDDLIEVTFVFD